MKKGAFALLDCLGFKGIWQKTDATTIIKNFKAIQDTVQSTVDKSSPFAVLQAEKEIRVQVGFLSDTVALSLQFADDNDGEPGYLIENAIRAVAHIIRLYVMDDPPFGLRGCVTYGAHICEGNFLIGPAVDDAAVHMEQPQGAFVWLLPNVRDLLQTFQSRRLSTLADTSDELIMKILLEVFQDDPDFKDRHIGTGSIQLARNAFKRLIQTPHTVFYPMPIKSGGTFNAEIVNPFMVKKTVDEVQTLMKRFLTVDKGTTIDTWQKNQNTIGFLDIAEKAATRWLQESGNLKAKAKTDF